MYIGHTVFMYMCVWHLQALEPIHFGLQLVQEQCIKLINNSLDFMTK